jgi:hypothetical protein
VLVNVYGERRFRARWRHLTVRDAGTESPRTHRKSTYSGEFVDVFKDVSAEREKGS